ncbi:glutathione peroxidase [uncultured Draconibacterium sp.]|uniref:glutathione peroxidase n=1 Tax=uncultured Draconibacterium sp. TaxID=1573823 RepID=UPI002AA7F430|nr:glutathione peroxidase [uncultured Draconibacterium sp.]
MRIYIFILLLFCSVSVMGQFNTLHDFSGRTIDGDTLHFSSLAGKKVLVVNTASECMLTPQYKKLQELYEEYGGDDFEIVAFPCNDFGHQEPGDSETIKEFCKQYEISFTLMEKISIKENPPPLYKWLMNSKQNGTLDAKVWWNFQKFMIDEEGNVVDFLGPQKSPLDKKLTDWLKQ